MRIEKAAVHALCVCAVCCAPSACACFEAQSFLVHLLQRLVRHVHAVLIGAVLAEAQHRASASTTSFLWPWNVSTRTGSLVSRRPYFWFTQRGSPEPELDVVAFQPNRLHHGASACFGFFGGGALCSAASASCFAAAATLSLGRFAVGTLLAAGASGRRPLS